MNSTNLHSLILVQRRYQNSKSSCKSLLTISSTRTCCYYSTQLYNQKVLLIDKPYSTRTTTMKFRAYFVAATSTSVASAWTTNSNHRQFLHTIVVPKSDLSVFDHISTTCTSTSSLFGRRNTAICRMSTTAVIDEEVTNTEADKDVVVTNVPTTSTTTTNDRLGKTIAEGTIFKQYPGGFAAIQINEEFTADTDSSIQLQTDGLVTPKRLSTIKVEVGDYQGKQVVFPDGTIGVVVAHRAPLVFVYKDNDQTQNNTKLLLNISATQGNSVRITSQGARVSVSTLNNVVDCFGRPFPNNDDEQTTVISSSTSESDEASIPVERDIFSTIPQVKDIALINNPMLTGITMIDTLASIGRGQNMLLVGHDINNMRDLVIDFLTTQVGQENTKCIYASTEEDRYAILDRFQHAGLDSNDIQLIVSTKSSASNDDTKHTDPSRAAEAVVIASTACAIGESYALTNGQHSLVIVDAIDYHKKLWDCTTRLMIEVFGADSVVKSDREGGSSSEMRVFFSSLIQRSAQYKISRGSGSVTLLLLVTIPKESNADDDSTVFTVADFKSAPIKIQERINVLVQKNIPLTASTLRKIKIPIPTDSEGQRRFALQHVDDLISMSDGQIWLDERLELSGRRPPVDPQRSVTRIGIGADTESRADAPALRRVAEGLRLELSQASDNLVMTTTSSSNSGVGTAATTTSASQYQNRKQQALLLAMHQESNSAVVKPRRLSESCVALIAAQKGYLNQFIDNDNIVPGSEKGTKLIIDLLRTVTKDIPEIMSSIDTTLDITAEQQRSIMESIQSFVSTR